MNLGSNIQGPDDHDKQFVAPPFEPVLDDEVLDKDERENQRRTMALDVRSQSAGLDPAARHGIHRVPGAAPIAASELDRERAEDLSAARLLSVRGRPLPAVAEENSPAPGVLTYYGAPFVALLGGGRADGCCAPLRAAAWRDA